MPQSPRRFYKQDTWGPPPYISGAAPYPAPTSQGGAISPVVGSTPTAEQTTRITYAGSFVLSASGSFRGTYFSPPTNKQWLVEWATCEQDYDFPVYIVPPNVGDPLDFVGNAPDNATDYYAFTLGDPAQQFSSPPPSYKNLDPPLSVPNGWTIVFFQAFNHDIVIRVQEF